MCVLDSWVWLEHRFDGEAAEAAEDVIRRAKTEGGFIAPTVVAEVRYRVQSLEGRDAADDAVRFLTGADEIERMPLVDEIASYAADLRCQYYDAGTCELSYADAIHVATASLHDECEALYTGDPDFADVEEVETIVLER